MCVFGPGVSPPVYVSVWLALDDCDSVNGCLEVYSKAANEPKKSPLEKDEIKPSADWSGGLISFPSFELVSNAGAHPAAPRGAES